MRWGDTVESSSCERRGPNGDSIDVRSGYAQRLCFQFTILEFFLFSVSQTHRQSSQCSCHKLEHTIEDQLSWDLYIYLQY